MKEFVEKLIGRLKEKQISVKSFSDVVHNNAVKICISEVNQLAEEYGKDTNVTTKDCSKCSRRSWYQRGYADAEKNNGWIPCSERLPRIGEQVMVCNRFGSVFTSHITYLNPKVDRHGECHDFGNHYGVIAWQPLPTPFVQK